MRDIIYSEIELAISVNQIERKITELITINNKCREALHDLSHCGIETSQMNMVFSNLDGQLEMVDVHLQASLDDLSESIQTSIQEVAEADVFTFPSDIMEGAKELLTTFFK